MASREYIDDYDIYPKHHDFICVHSRECLWPIPKSWLFVRDTMMRSRANTWVVERHIDNRIVLRYAEFEVSWVLPAC